MREIQSNQKPVDDFVSQQQRNGLTRLGLPLARPQRPHSYPGSLVYKRSHTFSFPDEF